LAAVLPLDQYCGGINGTGVHTGVMRLHSLQSVYEKPASGKIHSASLCHDCPGNLVPRPKRMPHPTVRHFGINSVCSCSVIACHKGWSQLGDFEIYQTVGVHDRFDCKFISVLRESDRNVVGKERELFIVKSIIFQGICRPKMWSFAVGIKDFGTELTGYADTTSQRD
jgi:hypothetical protein